MSRALGSVFPVMKTTGVGVGRLRRRSRSSGPLRPGHADIEDEAIHGQRPGLELLGGPEHTNVVAQTTEKSPECPPHTLVVVDNAQRHRFMTRALS